MSARSSAKPLRLQNTAKLPECCVKCGTFEHLEWKEEVLMFTRGSTMILAALFGALGGLLFRPHVPVRVRVPICGDCEARWAHAKDGHRRVLFGTIAGFFALGLGAYLFEAKSLGLLALVTLIAGLVYGKWFQRAHLRKHGLWIEDVEDDATVIGGIHRKVHKLLEPERSTSYRDKADVR